MFVLHEVLVMQVRPPFAPGWTDSTTDVWSLVEWDGGPELTARVCSLETRPVMGAVTRWPTLLVERAAEHHRPVALDGATLRIGPVTESLGPGDADGDGFPGITMVVEHPRIGAGEVYVHQTARSEWTGTRRDDGGFGGSMEWSPTQAQLGATRWWLKRPLGTRPADGSTFELLPTATDTTCVDVRARLTP